MPVRSLNSSLLRWPDRDAVHAAVSRWAAQLGDAREDVVRVGYFGSYAREDWGVGSDLDVVVVVTSSDAGFTRRALDFDATSLPVPADVLVYTADELDRPVGSGFLETVRSDTVWVYDRSGR